ncbi:uncharacterized protein LOC110028684 [Phalaenopsis equestris]|uniref:uncharacterized protein LOC110028684 n=1 Tax=Phalaenopsis equestris TaxID=78828 RepID=UPI0009E61102|nr:uncharacterized protein LOC110028684 [Phalaenopsis equestris]
MAQLPLFRSQKHVSPNTASAAATAAVTPIDSSASAAGKQCLPCSGGLGRRLVRKLKKQSRMLCTAGRTPAAVCGTAGGDAASFQCQYDPLSYSRNFDGCCALDDDSSHSYYTFSSRFARPLAAAAASR